MNQEVTIKAKDSSKDSTKAISIKLKTKSFKTKSSNKKETQEKAAASAPPVVPVKTALSKQHANDIAKWQERQVEKQKDAAADQQQTEAKCNPATNEEEKKKKEVTKTAKGEPICMLCRRKF